MINYLCMLSMLDINRSGSMALTALLCTVSEFGQPHDGAVFVVLGSSACNPSTNGPISDLLQCE